MKKQLLTAAFALTTAALSAQVVVETDLSQPGKPISTDLIGAFFEDINYAADGGLYAELVQNRSFEYFTNRIVKLEPLTAWSLDKKGKAVAEMSIESTTPLNENNTRYLKINISKAGEVALINSGYDGIPVQSGEKYRFSVYLRSDKKFTKPVAVNLVNANGKAIASGEIKGIGKIWQKYAFELTAGSTCPHASLQLSTQGKGVLYADMVSLFPKKTFMNRENGLRPDLAQAVADMKPRFLRFPGGCVSHGAGNDNAYRWKNTVGDVASRKPNFNLWEYHQTYGLGYFEYFQFCEDIGAKPLPVLPLGISCQFRNREIVPMDQMGPWVQDALDLVEFANGAVTTPWGKVRAEMGHPAPFNLEYVCLGNEEDDIPEFREHYLLISNALQKAHPEIKVLGTSGTAASGWHYDHLWDFSRENHVYAVDEHYYMGPGWFLSNNHRYDSFDRNGPKVFMGEYASQDDRLLNAIAEAAYLTGVERNADVIQFACYAPLFRRENNYQWNPDLIHFDNTRVSKSASYYVQQMYGVNAGDYYVNSSVQCDPSYIASLADYTGKVGVGSWQTQADFDDLKVVSGGKTIIDENFQNVSNWKVLKGDFKQADGLYQETGMEEPAWSICQTPVQATEYTITLKARKTGGQEGFIIPFACKGETYSWLNIGGWGNTQHAVETGSGATKSTVVTKSGHIENNRWYNIRIEVKGPSVKCYLDDALILDVPVPEGPVTASVTRDSKTGEAIIKLVNASEKPVITSLSLKNLAGEQTVKLTTLTGNGRDRNSVDQPTKLVPAESNLKVSSRFDMSLPAQSFQVFRVKLK